MRSNVDRCEVTREGDWVTIAFMDVFGIGEKYTFDVYEARRIRNTLTMLLDTPQT